MFWRVSLQQEALMKNWGMRVGVCTRKGDTWIPERIYCCLKKKNSQVNLMDWWKQEQRTWHVLEALGFENEGGISNALSRRTTAGALRCILACVLKCAWGGQAWTVSMKQMVYIPVTPGRVSSKHTSHPKDKGTRWCLIAVRSHQLTTAYFCFWSFYHHTASSYTLMGLTNFYIQMSF